MRVREETIKDPPADGSSIKWTLVEVVNKTKAPVTEAAASLEGTLWMLDSYVDSQGDLVSVLPNTEITAEFQDG